MVRISSITPISTGNVNARVIELDNGDLLAADIEDNQWVKKSTNGGSTWTTKYTYPHSDITLLLFHKDSRGYIYVGTRAKTNPYSRIGQLVRSKDEGETWEVVLTTESNALWKMTEAENGDLFVPEYSAGDGSANEIFGRNIWKSTDAGDTWSKWYTYPVESVAPTYNQGIRHFHEMAEVPDGFIVGAGDNVGFVGGCKTYLLDTDGTLVKTVADNNGVTCTTGNGWTAFVKSDTGRMFFGGDSLPGEMYEYFAGGTYKVAVSLTDYGNEINQVLLHMIKGKDGVLYALTNGELTEEWVSRMFASADDGATWVLLNYTETLNAVSYMSVNLSRENSEIFIAREGGQNYITIKDYTRAELRALYTSNLSIKGTITT